MGMINKIIHGDCLDVMKQIPDEKIDLIFTDPPYGIDYQSNRQGIDRKKSNLRLGDEIIRKKYFNKIKGDNEFPNEWLKEAYRILKKNSAIYIFCHWSKWSSVEFFVNEHQFKIKNMIVLNKSNHGMGDLKGSYAPKHELLLFACKGRHKLNFPDGRTNDIVDVKVKFSGSKRLHPNEKPIEWFIPFILNSSNENDIILDPFIGSGTTAIACIRTKRRFVGIEKDKHYWEIANQRIEAEYNGTNLAGNI